jgi:hypothetical protein
MRLRFDNAPAHELDGLEVAFRAGRRQAGSLELLGDIARGFAIPVGAGLTSLEAVVSQRLDMGPPARLLVVDR